MSFSADGSNLKLGRGALFLAAWSSSTPPGSTDLGTFVGNITALEMTSTNETREIYSSSQASSPLLDQRVIRQKYEMSATLDEHTLNNLKLFMQGTSTTVSQSAQTTASVTLTDVVPGNTYYLSARNISNVLVKKATTTKSQSTDVLVDTTNGLLTVLTTGTLTSGDDLTVTYTKPAATINKVRGNMVASPVYKLTFQSDDTNTDGDAAKDKLTVWKVSVQPDGAYGFISDDYSAFSLKFAVLDDSTHNPTEPFFTLERV